MLSIEEINNTIADLEQGNTTFSNCEKLASLYIVRDYFKSGSEPLVSTNTAELQVAKEYSDIMPRYQAYCDIKRRYQMKELTEDAVIESIKKVSKEILEFIDTLYTSTDMPEERAEIKNTIEILFNKYTDINM